MIVKEVMIWYFVSFLIFYNNIEGIVVYIVIMIRSVILRLKLFFWFGYGVVFMKG